MDFNAETRILVLSADTACARRWVEILSTPGDGLVWAAQDETPGGTEPEVVVAIGDSVLDEGRAEVGVVRIGGGLRADVQLPADAAPREVQLACRLLLEIVRLRRQVRSGVEVQSCLSQQALTDPLTGLPNRRAWDEAIAERMAAAASRFQRLCVAIFDLDFFKQVNDQCGHTVGDEVLRSVGQAFRHHLRHEDFVARLGGDEFGLLLWTPDAVIAFAVVDRVRNSLTTRPAWAEGRVVTASAGFCVAPARPAPLPCPDELLAAADAALRQAKQHGRDRTVEELRA